ncbi:glycosyltransferase [Lutibacter sp.]|uniref:glycosyltransferase n=1 Tax=Lutibacter sp. TaxID=1925666 RepID=UPI002734E3A6|nr:glycosyltransferase [Lutibacter sp.]MDP3312596.1 glycosyltransferase [Lutibacter sp.]
MKLLVISHTAHYIKSDGIVVGWGPTIKEINALTTIFDEIIHVAPLHAEPAPNSAIAYETGVIYKPLKPSGGSFLKKLTILLRAPFNLWQIYTYSKNVDFIQFRAPTGMGLYVLPYLKFCNRKQYWIKYAGNWVATNLSLGNKFQKWWLQHIISSKIKVTVNGQWPHEKQHILAFENPCLSEQERIEGLKVIEKKQLGNNYQYCFVGSLTENKGIQYLVKAFLSLDHTTIGGMHIVGDGQLKEQLELEAKQLKIPVHFYGYLTKDEIIKIYIKCHFIMLPSQSEGFPKVIGEAMNYGCVPIVSEVSCINQYIRNEYNGFLINPITAENIKLIIAESLEMSNDTFQSYININYKIAKKFTYAYYLERIKREILN